MPHYFNVIIFLSAKMNKSTTHSGTVLKRPCPEEVGDGRVYANLNQVLQNVCQSLSHLFQHE